MIAQYLLVHGDQAKLFEHAGHRLQSNVDDPELCAAFERKVSEASDIPDFITLLERRNED